MSDIIVYFVAMISWYKVYYDIILQLMISYYDIIHDIWHTISLTCVQCAPPSPWAATAAAAASLRRSLVSCDIKSHETSYMILVVISYVRSYMISWTISYMISWTISYMILFMTSHMISHMISRTISDMMSHVILHHMRLGSVAVRPLPHRWLPKATAGRIEHRSMILYVIHHVWYHSMISLTEVWYHSILYTMIS